MFLNLKTYIFYSVLVMKFQLKNNILNQILERKHLISSAKSHLLNIFIYYIRKFITKLVSRKYHVFKFENLPFFTDCFSHEISPKKFNRNSKLHYSFNFITELVSRKCHVLIFENLPFLTNSF